MMLEEMVLYGVLVEMVEKVLMDIVIMDLIHLEMDLVVQVD